MQKKKGEAPTKPESFLDDFLGAAVTVADIAVKVLPLLLSAESSPRPKALASGYAFGDMSFMPYSGEIFAINDGDVTANLAFSLVKGEGPPLSVAYLNIPPSSGVEIGKDFHEFDTGLATVSPAVVPQALGSGIIKAISFAIRWLSIAAPFVISGQLGGEYYKTQNGFGFRLGFDKPLTQTTGQLSVTSGGTSVSVKFSGKTASSKGENGYFLDVPLPVGTDLEPIIEQTTIYIEMPAEIFDDLAAESRKKVRSMVELGIRRPRPQS